jgi:DNA-binding NtrC family response regulator
MAVQEHRPVVTIIEYQLADGCGLDLLRELRSQHPETVPVIATASGSERICAAAFRLGAADYLIKPISPPDLLETIRPLLPLLHDTRRALVILEVWNLAVIGAALVGFNYVPLLATSAVTFWAIWLAAIGTVVVTGYAVYIWTRG